MSARSSIGFICARCQWRLHSLAVRPRLRKSLQPQLQLRRNSTAEASFADLPSVADTTTDGPEGSHEGPFDDHDTLTQPKARTLIRREPSGPGSHGQSPSGRQRHRGARSQYFKSKGEVVAAEEEALSIGMLGKPAHAIVIRGKGRSPKRPVMQQTTSSAARQTRISGSDLEQTAAQQALQATLEEAHNNLDELNPGYGSALSGEEFDRLRRTLVEGFTTSQLLSYLKKKQKRRQQPADLLGLKDAPGLINYVPWAPYLPVDAPVVADENLLGYVTRGMAPKDIQALRVIRNGWNVSMQELLASPGVMVLDIEEISFQLLLATQDDWLLPLQEGFLQEGSRIDLVRETKSVSIVAPKAVAESVALNIGDVLRSMRTEIIDVSNVTTSTLSEKMLQTLSSITQTHISHRGADHSLLAVRSYVSRDQNLGTAEVETKAEVVYRLLLASHIGEDIATSTVFVHPPGATGVYLLKQDGLTTQSWNIRLTEWGRWLAARPAASTAHAYRMAEVIPTSVLASPVIPLSNPQHKAILHPLDPAIVEDVSTSVSKETGWTTSPVHMTSAVFGHIMHPFAAEDSEGFVQSAMRAPVSDSRIMVPVTPPLSSLALPTRVSKQPPSTILMRFLPEPSAEGLNHQGRAPELLLSLDLLDDSSCKINYVRAIASHDVIDILQPRHAVDVRITQQSYFEVSGQPAVEEHIAPLADFVHRSQISLAHSQLKTPARARGVPLAHHLLRKQASGAQKQLSNAQDSDANEETAPSLTADGSEDGGRVHVDYVFAGLELQYTAATGFDGWQLAYTVIEGGKSRGSRAELRLTSAPANSTDQDAEQRPSHDSKHFMTTLSKLAHDAKFWDN